MQTAPETGVYGWNIKRGGTHFHRVAEPLRVAAEHGIRTGMGVELGDQVLAQHDTVVAYQLTQEHASKGWRELAARGTHRLVFDIDDAMWQPDWEPFKRYYSGDVIERMKANIRCAHVVTTPSAVIAEWVAPLNPNVHIVPYTMPQWVLDIPRPPVDPQRKLVLGFAGSASHDKDLTDEFLVALYEFLVAHPGWEMHLWGKSENEVSDLWTGRTKVHPWTDDRMMYYSSLRMDVGIAPLRDTVFNRCKSSLRFIENAARGICTVVSDLPPYRGYVRDGINGIALRDTDYAKEWAEVLRWLAEHPIERIAMGNRARRDAREWTTEANIHRWVDAWNSV